MGIRIKMARRLPGPASPRRVARVALPVLLIVQGRDRCGRCSSADRQGTHFADSTVRAVVYTLRPGRTI